MLSELKNPVDPPASSCEMRIVAVRGNQHTERDDWVTIEEPLEIRLRREGADEPRTLAITMRTPDRDEELAIGFLWSEGILTSMRQVRRVQQSGPIQPGGHRNIVVVTVENVPIPAIETAARNFYMTSSCGICGKASIEAIALNRPFVLDSTGAQFPVASITRMPGVLRDAQETFDRTGGLHAAGLFDVSGTLTVLREDVGRHNAVDKVVGASILAKRLPLSNSLLFVSGRASFELVQKAAMGGIPVLAAVGAPSSLAISLAREVNLTLIGFVRGDRFNIYSAADRVQFEENSQHAV